MTSIFCFFFPQNKSFYQFSLPSHTHARARTHVLKPLYNHSLIFDFTLNPQTLWGEPEEPPKMSSLWYQRHKHTPYYLNTRRQIEEDSSHFLFPPGRQQSDTLRWRTGNTHTHTQSCFSISVRTFRIQGPGQGPPRVHTKTEGLNCILLNVRRHQGLIWPLTCLM